MASASTTSSSPSLRSTPPPLLAPHPATAAVAALLAGYSFEPIATVYCGYPPQDRLPFPMLGLGHRLPGQVGQWVFDRGALCGTPGVLSLRAERAWRLGKT
jgi:hypothetical protein